MKHKENVMKYKANVTNSCNASDSCFISGGIFFWKFKRFFDISISLILLPILLLICLVLYPLNFYFNKGSIFYMQNRMGLRCVSFTAIKFRTMSYLPNVNRKYDEPLEINRITKLGNFLRKSRIDELPQIINVLRGEMSLIGPRPDYYEHAVEYLNLIKGYRMRHVIRPGISGLAQIQLGYAQDLEATRNKVNVDLYYIKNAGFFMDTKITINTIITIFKRIGI